MPTKLRRLKKEAKRACDYKKHKMSKFKKIDERRYSAHCDLCNCYVAINLKPLPNEIEIFGTAFIFTCF
jgi:hypothetical protein